MKIRQFGTALIWMFLGAGAYWAVSTHTSLLQFLQKRTEFRVVDTNQMNWVEGDKREPARYFMKFLYHDVSNGQIDMLVRYPAGQIMPAHKHSQGHGMYVLSGKLVTDRGTFGPGTFVWSPANEVISHGASPDEDAVVLFLRHDDMDIQFVHPVSH